MKKSSISDQIVDYTRFNLAEIILLETYILIGENIDLLNVYDYEAVGKTIWSFKDKNSIEHIIKLNYNPTTPPQVKVKFFWINKGRVDYSKPPYTDEKVFNTHLNILVQEILPYVFTELFNNPKIANDSRFKGLNKVELDATDEIRYRLYRKALSSGILSKTNFTLEDPKENNILNLIPKTSLL
jgi:hypothetical protein